MYQSKNIVGSSQNANLNGNALFLKISQKKERLASNVSVVGGKQPDGIISIRKSMLVGFPTSSIIESIYNKSSAIVGSVVGSIIATSSAIQQSIGTIINVGMLNNQFQQAVEPVFYEVLPIPLKIPPIEPIIPQYIFNYFDIDGLELISGEYKTILNEFVHLNISTSISYKKYIDESVIYITSKVDCSDDQINRLSNRINLSNSNLFNATDTSKNNIGTVDSMLDFVFGISNNKISLYSSEYVPFGDYPILNQSVIESDYLKSSNSSISNQSLDSSFDSRLICLVSSQQNIYKSFTDFANEPITSNQSIGSVDNYLPPTSNFIVSNQKLTDSFKSISVNSSTSHQNILNSYYVFADSTISDYSTTNQRVIDSNNSSIYQHESFIINSLSNSNNSLIVDNILNINQSLDTSMLSMDRSMLSKNNTSLAYGDATGKDTSNIIEPAISDIELRDSFLKRDTLLTISSQSLSDSNVSFITEPVSLNLEISDSYESTDENRIILSNLKLLSSSILLSDIEIAYNNNSILNSDLIVITDQLKHNINILDSSISKINDLVSNDISNIYSNIDFSYLQTKLDIEINSSDLSTISEDIPHNLHIIGSDTNKFAFNLSSSINAHGGGYIGSSFFIPSDIKIVESEYLSIPTNVDTSFNIGLISSSSIKRPDDINGLNNYININNSTVIGQTSPYLNSNLTIHKSSSYLQVVFPMDSINITLDSDLVTWDNDFYPDPI